MNKQLLEDIGESHYPPPSPGASGRQPKVQATPVPEPAAPPSAASPEFKVWRQGKPPEEQIEQTFTDRPAPGFTFTPPPELGLPEAPPSWFERWGRRAAITTISFIGVTMVCFGAFSVYQDRTDEKTLILLADTAPQLPPKPLPPVKAAAAVVPPAEVPAPPAEEPVATPLPAAKPAELVMLEAEPAPEPAPPPVKVRPRIKAVVAKAPERVRDDAPPMSPFSAMLKECRALGYHTEQCIKRACVLTKYGLACKG